MGVEVIIRPVGNPDGFDPAEALRVHLRVPAIGRVVRPFIREVLAEPEPFRPYPDRDQKFMGESDVVGNILVGNDTFIHCFPHRHFYRMFTFLLVDVRQKRHPVVCVPFECRVTVLLVRVDEDLGLCLREFTEPDHALPWRDLVPVGFADLHCAKGQLVPVEPQKPCKVHEHSLCCLGAQVANPLRTGAYRGREHQVEVVDLDVPEHLAAGGTFTPCNCTGEGRVIHRRCPAHSATISHVVCPQVFLAVRALAHLVGEAFHVAGCDKDRFLCNCRALDLVISFLDDVKMPPDILASPLHHRTERAVINKTSHRSITFRGGPDKPPALGQIHYILKNITHAGSLKLSSLIQLHDSRQKGSCPGTGTIRNSSSIVTWGGTNAFAEYATQNATQNRFFL